MYLIPTIKCREIELSFRILKSSPKVSLAFHDFLICNNEFVSISAD